MPKFGDEKITARDVKAWMDPRNHGLCELCPRAMVDIGGGERVISECNGKCMRRNSAMTIIPHPESFEVREGEKCPCLLG